MSDEVMAVLTAKSVETCLATGGTQSWVLDRVHSKHCRYAVLCRNAHHKRSEGNEPHGTAFMIGHIADVVPSTDREDRWLVRFDKYAVINEPRVWKWRNPVRYTTFEELGIDVKGVKFQPMPDPPKETQSADAPAAKPLTKISIAEAKRLLAATFGVKPEAVEITVRG